MEQADKIYRGLMTGFVCIMNLLDSNGTVRTIGIAACERGSRPVRGRPSFDMQLLLVNAEFTGKKLGGMLLDQLLLSVPDKSAVNVRLPECLNSALPVYLSRSFSQPLAGNAGNNQFSTLDVDHAAIAVRRRNSSFREMWPVMETGSCRREWRSSPRAHSPWELGCGSCAEKEHHILLYSVLHLVTHMLGTRIAQCGAQLNQIRRVQRVRLVVQPCLGVKLEKLSSHHL